MITHLIVALLGFGSRQPKSASDTRLCLRGLPLPSLTENPTNQKPVLPTEVQGHLALLAPRSTRRRPRAGPTSERGLPPSDRVSDHARRLAHDPNKALPQAQREEAKDPISPFSAVVCLSPLSNSSTKSTLYSMPTTCQGPRMGWNIRKETPISLTDEPD